MLSKFVILAVAVILAAPIYAGTGGGSSGGGSSTGQVPLATAAEAAEVAVDMAAALPVTPDAAAD
jgi:hypothetical protein